MVLKDCSSADPDEVGFSSKRLSQHPTSNGVLISCADMSEEYLRYPRTPLEPIACRPCNEASAVSHPCTAYLASKMARRRECLIRETEWKHTHSTQRVEARGYKPTRSSFLENPRVQAYTGLQPTVCERDLSIRLVSVVFDGIYSSADPDG